MMLCLYMWYLECTLLSFHQHLLYIYIYIYIYIYRVRFMWDQAVSMRPVRPTFFTWNFTPKHCEGKKNRTFIVKPLQKLRSRSFLMWRFDFLLPSQHFRSEGLNYLFHTFTAFLLWRFHFFTPFWIFFYLESIF